MKALKIVLGILATLGVVYLILCFTGPKKMDVSESMTMDAPAETVYAQVADLKNWKNWSVWNLNDPEMEVTYGEKTMGAGASYSWTSEESGDGNLEVVEATPNKSMKTKIQFSDWGGYSYGSWVFAETEGKTEVTWSMEADSDFPFFLRGMMGLINMEGMVKKDFEAGLTNIKKLAEKAAQEGPKTYGGYEVKNVDMPEKYYVTVRGEQKFENISAFLGTGYGMLIGKMGAQDVEPIGMPCGIYYNYDENKGTTDMAAAMPVATAVDLGEGTETVTLPAGKAYVIDYYGSYDDVMGAHQAMAEFAEATQTNLQDIAIEVYATDPGAEPDTSKWLTQIIYYGKQG